MKVFPNILSSPIEFKDRQFIHMTNWSKFVSPQEFSLDLVRYSLWNFSQKLWCVTSNTNWYHFIFYLVPLKLKHMCNLSLQHIKSSEILFCTSSQLLQCQALRGSVSQPIVLLSLTVLSFFSQYQKNFKMGKASAT